MKKQTKQSSAAKVSESKHTSDHEEEFPGYPKYPTNEDIMNRGDRINVDLDTAGGDIQSVKRAGPTAEIAEFKNLGTPGNSDLTKDDFQALGSDEIESEGDDEILQNRVWPVDFAGEDLDIPGSEQDDSQEILGSEDEENNAYSIGSDRHSDLEEDPS